MANIHTVNNGTLLKTACAIVFVLFVFTYLFFFQADLLSMVQHVLSGGTTHYDRTIGSVVITAVLFLVHVGALRLGGLGDVFHAFTYVPSLLLLVALTSVDCDFSGSPLNVVWLWLVPLLIVVYVVLSLAVRFRGCTRTLSAFHYRLRVENLLNSGAYAKALLIGDRSDDADPSLTMLRIYALSRSKQLGERLFEYPLSGGSGALLPDGKNVRCLFFQEDRIFKSLSIRKMGDMAPMDYLLYIERNGLAMKPVTDYILCGYLLDKKLDAFVAAIRHKYNLSSSTLPKHYKEALTLYTHLRANPVLVFHNEVMDADYADFQKLEKEYKDERERESYVHDTFGDTYWFYYFYHE